MSRFAVPVLLLLLLAAACVVDQEDPYNDYDSPTGDWPSLDPNRYHWDGLQDPYYEGWFFRLIIPSANRAFSFLYVVRNPGSLDDAQRESIVLAVSDTGQIIQQRFPAEDFRGSRHELDVHVGDANRATTDRLSGDIHDNFREVAWNIDYQVRERWDETMGLLTNIPLFPVNWYVGALRADSAGTIDWNGEHIAFDDGLLFQDKNWGDLFPDSYVWLQGMLFADPENSIAFSGGPISGHDTGMLVWRHGEERHETRSQDFNAIVRIEPDSAAGKVQVDIMRNGEYFILDGSFADASPAPLPAPSETGFDSYSLMALTGELRARRYELVNGQWLLRDDELTRMAGVEIGGDYVEAGK